MRPHQARFITVCQQLLALGVVLAFLTPASGVISLDVVGEAPGRAPASGSADPAVLSSATVPTRAVEPQVTEVPLTTATGSARALVGRTVVGTSVSATRVTSKPQPVSGFGAVGVTWQTGEELDEGQIDLQVRTRSGDTWTDWAELEYHDDHGPDPDSAEGRDARPGSDPMIVGDVDAVQVKAATASALPDDLSMAVIAPGDSSDHETEAPAIDTGDQAGAASYDEEFEQGQGDRGTIVMRAARAAPQPTIFSRAQWGADESMRDKGSLRYGTISAAFVHHTVNANDYTEAQVPAIMRSIYAYHVKSRGWSDIGYNFLVDRFGRIWEGRYGGIDKAVVGAHTLGYNEYSFAMSAIGNFETTQPTDVMLRAYGALFAWKLGLAGVNPASTSQRVGGSTFKAINGHRDAGSTACPGKYLYAKLPVIRQYASSAAPAPAPAPPPPVTVQVGEPALQSNLVGTPYPDLVVRRTSDGRAFILPTGGLTSFTKKSVVSKKGWAEKQDVVVSPDLTGDGLLDLVSTSRKGVLKLRPGKGNGKFAATTRTVQTTRGHSLLAAVGDINKDGRNDLVARYKGRLVAFVGAKAGGFKRVLLLKGFGGYLQLIGAGDQNGDGNADLIARDGKGRLHLYAGNGQGGFAHRVTLAGSWGEYNRVIGGVDYSGDGRADLLARNAKGEVFVRASRGDGTFGPAYGPSANLRSLRSISGAGTLAGDASPDLVGVKENSLVLVPNRGTYELGAPIDTGVVLSDANLILNVGDWDRDGGGDVMTRDDAGNLWLYRGNGAGQLNPPTRLAYGFGAVAGLAPVGDVTGDGYPDLMGTPSGGALSVYAGTGTGIKPGQLVASKTASARTGLPVDLSQYDWVIGVSDMQLGSKEDYVVRQRDTGYLYLYNGTTSGVRPPRFLGEGLGAYNLAG